MTDKEKMNLVNQLGRKALAEGEVPVAAIIFLDDKIISQAWSSEIVDKRFLVHAEQKALEQADKLKMPIKDRKRLELFTNLEPCMMCLGMSISAFVGTVVYSLDAGPDGAAQWASETWDQHHPDSVFSLPEIRKGVCKAETIRLFTDYVGIHKSGPYVGFVKEVLSLSNQTCTSNHL